MEVQYHVLQCLHAPPLLACPYRCVLVSEAHHPQRLSRQLCRALEDLLEDGAKSECNCELRGQVTDLCSTSSRLTAGRLLLSFRRGQCSSRSSPLWSPCQTTANFLNSATPSFTTRLNGGNEKCGEKKNVTLFFFPPQIRQLSLRKFAAVFRE